MKMYFDIYGEHHMKCMVSRLRGIWSSRVWRDLIRLNCIQYFSCIRWLFNLKSFQIRHPSPFIRRSVSQFWKVQSKDGWEISVSDKEVQNGFILFEFSKLRTLYFIRLRKSSFIIRNWNIQRTIYPTKHGYPIFSSEGGLLTEKTTWVSALVTNY